MVSIAVRVSVSLLVFSMIVVPPMVEGCGRLQLFLPLVLSVFTSCMLKLCYLAIHICNCRVFLTY